MEKLLTIRCSEAEYEGIKARAKAAGRPMADWARETLLAVQLLEPPPTGEAG